MEQILSLPHMKRILRRMGLRKNNNAKPLIEITQEIFLTDSQTNRQTEGKLKGY